MTTASAERLRSMIDTADEHMRMLRRFNIETDQWSSMVCVILLGKLDATTRNQWETKVDLPEMPDINALFVFLEQRILAIRNVEQSSQQGQRPAVTEERSQPAKTIKAQQANGNRYHPYGREQRKSSTPSEADGKNERSRKVEQRAQSPAFAMCGPDVYHFLWQCDSFRKLTVARKEEELAKWGICRICLVAKHAVSECTKGNCPICKTEKHNSAICPKAPAKRVNHVRAGKTSKGSDKRPA